MSWRLYIRKTIVNIQGRLKLNIKKVINTYIDRITMKLTLIEFQWKI